MFVCINVNKNVTLFRDGSGSSFVTHDLWPLHRSILRMGLGGGVAWWYWTTVSPGQEIVD